MIEPLLSPKPDGEDDAARLLEAAREFGYSDGVLALENALPEASPRAVVVSKATVRSARDAVATFRPDVDLLYVEPPEDPGPFARDERVDGLIGLAETAFLGDRVLRAARDHDVALVFDLSPVLMNRGRYRALKRMNANARRCRENSCPAVLTSGASSVYGVRAPREVAAVAKVAGFTEEQTDEAMRLPGELLEARHG